MSAHLPASFPALKLPEQPSLEQLRKQTKDLLQEYREGDPNAMAEVRRFECQLDSNEHFALADAQRVLQEHTGLRTGPNLKRLWMEQTV